MDGRKDGLSLLRDGRTDGLKDGRTGHWAAIDSTHVTREFWHVESESVDI